MKRMYIVILLIPLFAPLVIPQEIPLPECFQVTDLQLISHEEVSAGTVAYDGPTCAAIVLAWLADHGFRALLPDLNGDGTIDERDTVALAEKLSPDMRVRPDRGTLDPWLVDAIARYVGKRYPNQFVVKIYDDTFRQEYSATMGQSFDPNLYPNISFELYPNASRDDYAEELLSAEGVILGLGPERGHNRYFVGRSFEFQQGPGGWPIDVVDTSDDPGVVGLQGQVFPTYMRKSTTHWLVAYGGWQPLEFMLALSPLRKPGPTGEEYPCAINAFGYDVTKVETDFGAFEVEECAVHDGTRDLYIYTVRNIDFLHNGCGICEFFIPNTGGLATLDQWGPTGWLVNAWYPSGWSWTAPSGDCGIMPGSSAVFGFAVPAPTTDVVRPAMVSSCLPSPTVAGLEGRLRLKFSTTGPEVQEEGCPDLVVKKIRACWYIDAEQRVHVRVNVRVKNEGTTKASNVYVCITAGGQSTTEWAGTILPGSTDYVSAEITLPPGSLSFPIPVHVVVDCKDKVKECDETNNVANASVDRADTCR
ncbi:CARDB domain-containing protein [Candidatus Bipolaricaulota sp. J31]